MNSTPINFTLQQRVYYEDTDALGIVYHANYLCFMERARSEWLWRLGINFEELSKRQCRFVVHHISIDYIQPARLSTEIDITVGVSHFGKSSMTLTQSVRSSKDPSIVFATAEIRIVTIDPEGKPRRIPEDILQKIKDSIMLSTGGQ